MDLNEQNILFLEGSQMNTVPEQAVIPINKTSLLLPFLALLTATIILSFAAILIRLTEFDLKPGATVFNRYWIAAVTLSLWQSTKFVFARKTESEDKPSEDVTVNDIILFATESLMSFGCISLWAISLTQTSVANANLLHNMTPIFTTLGGWLLLNQRFDNRFLVGMLIAILASSCIGFEDWFISTSNFTGDILALLSSVLYAGGFLTRESLRNKYSASTILLYSCFLRAVLALGLILMTEERFFPVTQSAWLSVLALGIIVQVFGHGLLTYSLKYLSSSFAAVCLLIDPLITALLGWIIFAEKLTPLNLVSLIGVLVGIYLAISAKGSLKSTAVEENVFEA
jgi:drug/metabolite transporter (DMT)-like permease